MRGTPVQDTPIPTSGNGRRIRAETLMRESLRTPTVEPVTEGAQQTCKDHR
jgi:hypothetical protein